MTDKNGPSLSNLAQLMLNWESLKRELMLLESAICDTVLQVGETVEVGYVRASYSGGRRTFDYQAVGEAADAAIIEKHTKTVTTTNWHAVCNAAKLEDVPFTKSAPSVRLKLIQ